MAEYEVVQDSDIGYRRIDPIPDTSELADYYQSQYPELLNQGDLGASVSRLREGGEDAERERQWKISTEYIDVESLLEDQMESGKLLDIGCGTGDFLSFMETKGWSVQGVEPSSEIGAIAKDKDLPVYEGTIEDFASEDSTMAFDAISLWNVLEHVPNPKTVIETCIDLLNDGGCLIIKVPNDFNPLQKEAKKALDCNDFWVNAPAHINYFDFESIQKLLSKYGGSTCLIQSDFPMSLFLLLGHNYLENSEVGEKCHWNRVQFELTISNQLRRQIYTTLAEIGIGRNCLTISKF